MESNFVCCICHKIPSNVVESACCNSLFCWVCVTGTPKQCPSCSKRLDPETCTENLAVKKIIESIEVKCSFAGCFDRILVSERPAHEATCPKGPTLCPNSELCGIMERATIAHHLLACQFRRIECHMCEVSLPLPHLQEHLDTVCPEVVAECQLCRQKILHMDNHTAVACPSVETECPFAPYGCTERPLRSQVEQHVADGMAEHIRLMGQAFQDQQNQIFDLRARMELQQQQAELDRNASRFDPETGVLYQIDQRLTEFVDDARDWEVWNHPFIANVRNCRYPRRAAFALFIFSLFLLKLTFCVLFSHRCTLVWTAVRIVKCLVKCVLIVKVCAMVVGRVWRGAAWIHSNRHFAAAVIALSIFVHFMIFG